MVKALMKVGFASQGTKSGLHTSGIQEGLLQGVSLGFSLEDEKGGSLTEKERRGASAKGNSSHGGLIYTALISS